MNMIKESRALLAADEYQEKVRLRGYNGPVAISSAVSVLDGANILIKLNPALSRQEHAELAEKHTQLYEFHSSEWGKTADAAAMETFGRKFLFEDYRISSIGSEAFSPDKKDKLRLHGHSLSKHRWLSLCHAKAAVSRKLRH
jgi:hypothetical protein